MSDNLQHHGVKGQKWGRRRYQNKDGSLTPEGYKRYGSVKLVEEEYQRRDENATANMKATKTVVDSSKSIAKSTKEISDTRSRKKQQKVNRMLEEAARERASKMTDQELREAVNRLNMEENYTRMVQNRERIELGESKVSKFMDRSMVALTLASTTLSIALAVKELKR